MFLQPSAANYAEHARIFSALGDETRLAIIAKLCKNQPLSVAELTENTNLTRQAISKHLRILECAGLVESVRIGRETLFEVRTQKLADVRRHLDVISQQWDGALERLQLFVE